MLNLNEDTFSHKMIDNKNAIQNKSIDYIVSSKNSTTTITLITPSLFFVNCPSSIKTKLLNLKRINFFAQNNDMEKKQHHENEDTWVNIKKNENNINTSVSIKKSNLTHYISQSNLIKNDNNKDETKEMSSSFNDNGSSYSHSLSSIPNHSPLLLNSSLSSCTSSNTIYPSSLSLINSDHIPCQRPVTPNLQVVVPSYSLFNNYSLSDCEDTRSSCIVDTTTTTSSNFCNQDLDFHKYHNMKYEKVISDPNIISKKNNLNLSTSKNSSQMINSTEDEFNYSFDNLKSSPSSSIARTKMMKEEENCVCGCNNRNHYCSYIDHKYKLIREKRRLIKSAIKIGFTDVYLKEDLDNCDDDEISSNCDFISPFSFSKNKNKEDDEKEDIINTILLSNTDFSTFPPNLKFTINTHDVWLRWSNLELNKDKFKDGHLL
ncbi:hypothetical protein U3516DRAFT_895279 [Neocallimastix sp. 'constans']|jgi:hypothetical protein